MLDFHTKVGVLDLQVKAKAKARVVASTDGQRSTKSGGRRHSDIWTIDYSEVGKRVYEHVKYRLQQGESTGCVSRAYEVEVRAATTSLMNKDFPEPLRTDRSIKCRLSLRGCEFIPGDDLCCKIRHLNLAFSGFKWRSIAESCDEIRIS